MASFDFLRTSPAPPGSYFAELRDTYASLQLIHLVTTSRLVEMDGPTRFCWAVWCLPVGSGSLFPRLAYNVVVDRDEEGFKNLGVSISDVNKPVIEFQLGGADLARRHA